VKVNSAETRSNNTVRAESPTGVGDGLQFREVEMRVSSRHLILASALFKCLLKGGFPESQSLSSTGALKIPLPDDDPNPLEIILNIIHGHVKKVPRKVDIDVLTQISVLIDKYAFHEVAEIFTDMWFENLRVNPPKTFTEDLMSWFCVSWVLSKPEMFRHITKLP
jgi:hypothetical protein